jgi:CRISPR-associated exonuclease Cas4
MYTEDELLPISALQHLLFCERQCALIHVERLWVENRLTAEGQVLHKKAHRGPAESRAGVRTTRGLPLVNFSLGLSGQADVIEWQPPPGVRTKSLAETIRRAAPEERQSWRVTPIEYKRGRSKANDCDRVQLCAQAFCLEEMLGISIPAGALFYGELRHREPVEFSSALREETTRAAERLHQIIDQRLTPSAKKEKKCANCSLINLCLPAIASGQRNVQHWIDRMLESS